jgi:hypothetical protein
MAENESNIQGLNTKRPFMVITVCIIVIVSVSIVDISLNGYEHDIAAPTFTHDFPETVEFENISEGVCPNWFSFIVDLQTNHTGLTSIVPRRIDLVFWFRDATDGSDLSQFVYGVFDQYSNSSISISMEKYDTANLTDGDWYAPSHLTVIFNDNWGMSILRYGVGLELLFINEFGDPFTNHTLNVRLNMTVTYSRWWGPLRISSAGQTETYSYNLPDDGTTEIRMVG